MNYSGFAYQKHKEKIEQYIDILGQQASLPSNISYFFSEARNWFLGKTVSDKPGIGMVGIYFPEVFIHALGARPVWILGGSSAAGEAVDDSLPRDVDPVVRSSVGYLNLEEMQSLRDCALVIVPLLSDSIKKSIPLFSEKLCIHLFDICYLLFAEKTTGWQKELNRAIAKLEKVTGKTLESENLKNAMILINKASEILHSLYKCYCAGSINNVIYFFLRQTYYMTADLSWWVQEMSRVVAHYEKPISNYRPDVYISLIGSPVYPPYNKIPVLLDSLDMTAKYIDVGYPEITKYRGFEGFDDIDRLLEQIGDKHYHETYGACHLTSSIPAFPVDVHGIVFHLLKGQLNYAFLNEKLDRQAVQDNIPMIMVETDYGNADIEQLRIRLEAFREMVLCR